MHIYSILLLLSALWLSPGRAEVSWSGAGCLYRQQTQIACYASGSRIELARGIDGAFAPMAGDVFTLVRGDGTKEETRLISRVYVGVVRR